MPSIRKTAVHSTGKQLWISVVHSVEFDLQLQHRAIVVAMPATIQKYHNQGKISLPKDSADLSDS